MGFDQNSVPNSYRIAGEEACIAPPVRPSVKPVYAVAAPPMGSSSSGIVPVVYYPLLHSGLLGVGYGNGVPFQGATGWVPQVVPVVVGSRLQPPVGMVAAMPQMYKDNNDVLPVCIPMQYQIMEEAVSSRPANGDHQIVPAMSSPLSDNHLCESPKHYHSSTSSMVSEVENQESFGVCDHQKLMGRGMRNLQIHPLQNKVSADSLKASDTRIPAGVMPQLDVNGFSESNGEEVINERWIEDRINKFSSNANADVNSKSAQSDKVSGSAEEFIKQELHAVAEGVAASVFQSPAQSQKNIDMSVENEDHLKEVGATWTWSEKMNIRSPLSQGIDHIQMIKNSDLQELRELGSGAFGTVYHGLWRGTDVAIKRINHRCFSGNTSEQDGARDDFWNEAINLASMHHPNVVAFYGVALDGPGGSVATVTEYMVDGPLRRALQKNERYFNMRNRLLIAMDIAFGMEYLHGKNMVHFDLKSDNLLVNLRDKHRPIRKVADLGLSKVRRQTLILGGLQGTLQWMAPELLDENTRVSEKELLTGEEPYADFHFGVIIGGIASNTLRPLIPESCDFDWRSLMERCWASEPAERPSFTEISNQLQKMASKHQMQQAKK